MNNLRWISAFLVYFAILFLHQTCLAQLCSREAIAAKYWQYRENFNKHFIVTDRRPEGCVGDGIYLVEDVHPASSTTQEHCGFYFLSGYSLPATSVNMHPNGYFGLDDRVDEGPFPDRECAELDDDIGSSNISYDFSIHNHLEMGEETPHQMQWYWTMLATEYALLVQNGQTEEAQRTLEELYLGLQAYRRMDMLANCMAEERYQEITNDFEVETCGDNHCLCGPKYVDSEGAFSSEFKTRTQDNCPFEAVLTGYTGFSLREDATQQIGALLHDPTDDMWNIDLVFSDYGLSQAPPCTTTFSQACYNVQAKNFLSHDQMYALMEGLVMIKKYIPADAWVTTCDGTTENVLNIAQNIGKGLVDVANNEKKRILWPGATECCDEDGLFNMEVGGRLFATYAGLQMMYNYLSDNDDREIKKKDMLFFSELGGATLGIPGSTPHPEGKFYVEGVAFGMDIMDIPAVFFPNLPIVPFPVSAVPFFPPRGKVISALDNLNVEIYGLINNLLFPGGQNVPNNKAFFETILCSAPCGGPCQKHDWYDQTLEAGRNLTPPVFWPEFECPNTPQWTGHRWEGLGGDLDWDDIYEARQFNGLDFMALYNIYLLHYPEEQPSYYYNPARPQLDYGFLPGENKIAGPTTLCPGESGNYSLVYPTTPIPSITWESSQNVTLSSTSANPTTATMGAVGEPAYIGVSYQEAQIKQQFYNGEPSGSATVEYQCNFYYQKPIINEVPKYNLVTEVDFCQWIFRAFAQGPDFVNGTTWDWVATDSNTGLTVTGDGLSLDFASILPSTPGQYGTVAISLTVENACGETHHTLESPYFICTEPGPTGPGTQGRQIMVSPNPANDQISIRVTENNGSQDFNSTDPNGVRIRIYPGNGGAYALMDTYLTANGQYFNVGSLPNGNYHIRANASDLTPIQTNLIIVR